MVKAIISYKFWVTACRCKLVFVFLDVCLGFLGGEIHWKSEEASNTGKVSCNKNNLPSCIWEITVIYTFHFSESRQNCVFLSQNL